MPYGAERGTALWPDHLRCEDDIEAATGTEVHDDFNCLKVSGRGRILHDSPILASAGIEVNSSAE